MSEDGVCSHFYTKTRESRIVTAIFALSVLTCQTSSYVNIFFLEHPEAEYDIACLLMVFVAVSIPKLARAESSFFKASVEGKSSYYLNKKWVFLKGLTPSKQCRQPTCGNQIVNP